MSLQRWQETLIVAQGDGTQLSNSTSATSIIPAQAKLTFPANYFGDVGKTMRIRAAGRISNVVTTPGTLTLDLRLGGTVVFNGGAMQLSTTAHTNVPWEWEVILTQRVTGASANFMGQSRWFSQAANVSGADSTTSHSYVMAPNTAPAVGTTFDATAAQQLDLFATFSVATNPTNLTLHQFIVESLN
jgi:hypothetical protein